MQLENSIQRTMLPSDEGAPGLVVRYRGGGWLNVRGGLTRQRARTLLAGRWAGLQAPLVPLRDRLLDSEPVAVVHAHGRTMLELIRRQTPDTGRPREVWYCVPGPGSAATVRRGLAKRGVAEDPLLVDFFDALNAHHDRPLPQRGNFVTPSRWRTIESLFGDSLDADNGRAPLWHQDYVIYEAPSGDALLYGRTGRMGWYIMPEARYERFWNGFKGFLRFYAEFQDRFSGLDSYSTSDFLGRA